MTANAPLRLTVSLHLVGEDGLDLDGRLAPAALELEEDDRLSSPSPLYYNLRAQMAGADLLVNGLVETKLRARCDRCLSYFDYALREPGACHLFEAPANDLLDLTDLIREDLLLLIPQKVLCREDCKGLCARCGQNLNVRPCSCQQEKPASDAWDTLDGLKL